MTGAWLVLAKIAIIITLLFFCIGFDCCYNRHFVNQKEKSSRALKAA